MLETKRLLIRQWQDQDIEEFTALNRDPEVMEFFPNLMSESEVRSMVSRCRESIEERGWGFSAVEERASGRFIGMVGIHETPFELPFGLRIEVGWRLAKAYWGKGYAGEAALACLDYAFNTLSVDAVCAFTPTHNLRSRRVMDKLGMTDLHKPFIHPRFEAGQPLAEHVLYAIKRRDFLQALD